jgi:hypothetical protein
MVIRVPKRDIKDSSVQLADDIFFPSIVSMKNEIQLFVGRIFPVAYEADECVCPYEKACSASCQQLDSPGKFDTALRSRRNMSGGKKRLMSFDVSGLPVWRTRSLQIWLVNARLGW